MSDKANKFRRNNEAQCDERTCSASLHASLELTSSHKPSLASSNNSSTPVRN